MPIYLLTRGRTIDYAFLGSAPKDLWWTRYREVTAFEYPTILVHSNGSTWQALLSGIPSARKDRVGTTIRYTLVLESAKSDVCSQAAFSAVAAWLDAVAAWPDDVVTAQLPIRLQEKLDAEFPENVVETILGDRGGKQSADVVEEKLSRAINQLTPRLAGEQTVALSSWVGAKKSSLPREAFLQRVQDLLNGRVGRALMVNLIGSEDEARTLVEQGEPAAVLIDDREEALGDDVVSLESKKKKDSPPSQSPNRETASERWVAWLLVGAVIIALLLWLLPKPSAERQGHSLRLSSTAVASHLT